ncbi:hypothetical protein D9758_015764 [Tetrapyrgos nigripes]|uniref:DNA 3'-5' helicase n=1 Tax=Tetrapyrgos nigripes TaxID=182062 RepID=A0A8H5CBZ0_9AGAR|nr:hypothetical protein D9758_015764 [Tetrapyrgos nigripes]
MRSGGPHPLHRLQLANGQKAWSLWQESQSTRKNIRISRNVKLRLNNVIEYGEVQFYFMRTQDGILVDTTPNIVLVQDWDGFLQWTSGRCETLSSDCIVSSKLAPYLYTYILDYLPQDLQNTSELVSSHLAFGLVALTPTWTDSEGLNTLKSVISQQVPQWPNGLRDYQLENIPRVLSGENLLLFAATGKGKSSMYIIPLLVHMEIRSNPHLYPAFVSQECNDFGLQGLSYCHKKITEYCLKKDDLASLICDCKMWQLICIDPEHLATPEWRKILDHKTFIKNLILFCVEEAHLIRTWGPDFRPCFQSIGAIAHGFIGEQTSLVGLSATCAPGAYTIDICIG